MIVDFCQKLGFADDDALYFENVYEALVSEERYKQLLERAENSFFDAESVEYKECLKEIAESASVHRYTVEMVFLLSCAEKAHSIYKDRGISDEIFFDTMMDLRYKLAECKSVYGVRGTFVAWWFKRHYRAELLALGRVQFEKIPFPYEDYKGIVKRGDTVYNFHVPASGSLDRDSLMDSFTRAYSFYSSDINGGIMPIYFSSWLIYPKTAALYKEGSNLGAFYAMFDIIDVVADERNRDSWRIYNKVATPENLDSLPESTSLQRSLKQYLKAGNCMGSGKGILLFDGKNIIQ